MIAPPPRTILIVALRRLGDVLLTTPLMRSLKRVFPDAAIDALVFRGTEGILAGNPDLRAVIAMPARPRHAETFALVRRLWRGYDLALSTQSGDRPTLFAWTAGRRSAGFVEATGILTRIKRLVLSDPVAARGGEHRVTEVLRLAAALGVPPVGEVVAPAAPQRPAAAPDRAYAVVHAVPGFRYKRWADENWRALAAGLSVRGLAVVATGGPDDRAELDAVWAGSAEIRRLDGTLSFPELAALIGGASVYIGPDTSVTHLAAATGAPTVALFGPTDPRLWGPWPAGGLAPPWDAVGTVQNRRNVWLVQNPLPCLPCQQEGCLRRLGSYSRCLDELTVRQVLSAVDVALAEPAAGRREGSAVG